jgi:hypothetical protein
MSDLTNFLPERVPGDAMTCRAEADIKFAEIDD